MKTKWPGEQECAGTDTQVSKRFTRLFIDCTLSASVIPDDGSKKLIVLYKVLTVRRDHLPATMVGNSSCRQLKKQRKNILKKEFTEKTKGVSCMCWTNEEDINQASKNVHTMSIFAMLILQYLSQWNSPDTCFRLKLIGSLIRAD
jgi:hypothetical protein